jgi:hypothetical protein
MADMRVIRMFVGLDSHWQRVRQANILGTKTELAMTEEP